VTVLGKGTTSTGIPIEVNFWFVVAILGFAAAAVLIGNYYTIIRRMI